MLHVATHHVDSWCCLNLIFCVEMHVMLVVIQTRTVTLFDAIF